MKLHTITTPLSQPDGTYRFALNAVTSISEVDAITNENGNKKVIMLPSKIKGSIYLYDDVYIVFLADNSIARVDLSIPDIEVLVQLPEFKFDELGEDEYVTGVYTKFKGCEDIVFFFDGKNTNKFFNISRPEIHKIDGQYDISLFEMLPQYLQPSISTQIVDGGRLEYGRYYFIVEFLSKTGDVLYRSRLDNNYTIINYDENEGAYNSDQYDARVGGRPPSNKAIKITIENLPDFVYSARIIAVRYIYGNGFSFDAVLDGTEAVKSQDSIVHIFRGYDPSTGDELVDIKDYLVPTPVYSVAYDGVLVENSLVLYNLKELKKDYSELQKSASKVTVKYVVSEVDVNSDDIATKCRTFAGGEILLLYIHYIYKDGSISPGFPLIGRRPNAYDLSTVVHVPEEGEVPRWKVESTATTDTTPEDGYYASGQLGYYQLDTTYDRPPLYDGDDYWGSDSDGISIQGDNIRLFVIPTRDKIPHVRKGDGTDYIYPIGLKFDNITYPSSDIIGHFFSVADIPSNIVSKGLFFPRKIVADFDDAQTIPGVYYDTSNSTFIDYVSGENYALNKSITSNSAHIEGYYRLSGMLYEEKKYKPSDNLFHPDLPYNKLDIGAYYIGDPTYNTTQYRHYNLDSTTFKIRPRQVRNNFLNASYSNTRTIVHLDRKLLEDSDGFRIAAYGALKSDLTVDSVFGLRVMPITDINSNISFSGRWFIGPMSWDNIAALDVAGRSIFETITFADSKIKCTYEFYDKFYLESRANLFLRIYGDGNCYQMPTQRTGLTFKALSKVVEPYEGYNKVVDSVCPYYHAYNADYSIENLPFKFYAISFREDFALKCINEFPTRYIWSNPQEEEGDTLDYTVFLPINYYDLPQDTGPITKIDYRDNTIIIRTTQSAYITKPNARSMNVDGDQVYLGTGTFLGIPPQRVNTNVTGFGGQQNKVDSINCDRGLIWINTKTKEVYHFANQFRVLHSDIRNILEEHIIERPCLFTYDNTLKRVIFTNKDNITLSYCFLVDGWKSFHSYIPQYYLYTADDFYSVYDNGIYVHNDSSHKHSFYEYKFDFCIEKTIKDIRTFSVDSVIIYMYVTSDGVIDINKSFDKFLAYNDQQTTGLKLVKVNDISSIYYEPKVIHCKVVDKMHKFSYIRDFASSAQIWSYDISPIKQGNNQGWIDKLPVADYTKPLHEVGIFRDKYVNVRGFFSGDERITVILTDAKKTYSSR